MVFSMDTMEFVYLITNTIRVLIDNIYESKIIIMITGKFQHTTRRLNINGRWFRPYLLGGLPPTFAFKYNANEDQYGITRWFNHKGLTYIQE